ALADLNDDGILDAVTSDFNASDNTTSNLYVLQQTSVATWVGLDGGFASTSSPGLSVNASFTGRSFIIPQIGIADVHGDGKPDLILAEDPTTGGTGQTLTYFNLGKDSVGIAQFSSTDQKDFLFTGLPDLSNSSPGGSPNSLALGDFTNDGQVD